VTYKGIVTLFPEVRPEVLTYQRERYSSEKLNRYLSPEKYWTAPVENASSLTSAKEIYEYVVQTLSYDDTRISKDLTRMGALWALKNPEKAVCMEYTDVFIALSRATGIPAREAIGYGVERSGSLQPVSFFGDLLHAWPEYYDRAREIWHPIDPTWGDTANLDYFSSLDMNHITLVYHGKETNVPLPPGVYKTNESTKDVYVKPAAQTPPDEGEIVASLPDNLIIALQKDNTVPLTVRSMANSVRYNVPISISDQKGTVLLKTTVAAIPPRGTIVVQEHLRLQNSVVGMKQGLLEIRVDGNVTNTSHYTAVAPWLKPFIEYWVISAGFIAILLVIGVIVVVSKKNHA